MSGIRIETAYTEYLVVVWYKYTMLKNSIFELIHSEFCYPPWQILLFSSVASLHERHSMDDISMENGEGDNDEE